jgi:hypothetical protein
VRFEPGEARKLAVHYLLLLLNSNLVS